MDNLKAMMVAVAVGLFLLALVGIVAYFAIKWVREARAKKPPAEAVPQVVTQQQPDTRTGGEVFWSTFKTAFAWLWTLFFIALFAFLAFVFLLPHEAAKTEQQHAHQVVKEAVKPQAFVFTLDQFVARYNRALNNMDAGYAIELVKADDNGKRIVATAGVVAGRNNSSMLLNADRVNNRVTSALLISGGDGSTASGLGVVIAMIALVMAIEDPDMIADERGRLVKVMAIDQVLKGKTIYINTTTARLSIKLKQALGGVWVTAEPRR